MSTRAQQKSSLKRKASNDLPWTFDDEDTRDINNHTQQQHASIKEVSALYKQTYVDTIVKIKRLLQYYAVVLAADVNPDADSVKNANQNADVKSVAAQEAKTELKVILDDLASKPELVEMEDVKKVLLDCGIVVDVRKGMGGEREVDVRLI
ncbi:hypothetical protein TMatcc_007975 [Talaromyces marneffei ATCC 18224]|uniref:Uncharacterized protein n=2 Tax=Talaromyces marneffei TaxID=37727 RepID=B6QE31_TALMQ|nr:uncharacterized protein EYB26_004884 [Talaromyces marneffei]EEA24876.1 hypothetical protein PMAA_088470 [Talaromyces marneffei ATCC 18224]KAE8552650.1 hypothetical protein EYB25_004029 [Talaromyces marneffei]QGA17214.1 hypothetical protein EYB26_004884 [Talaromyces marneffei]